MHSCLLIYFLILVETLKIADICQLGITIAKKLEVLTSVMSIHCHNLGSLEGGSETGDSVQDPC